MTGSPAATPELSRVGPLRFLAAWVLIASLLAFSGVMSPWLRAVPVMIPVLIWTVIGVVAVVCVKWPAMRAWLGTADLRPAVLFHLVRAPYGFAFLVLGSRGELDFTFAAVAGWGDLIAGLTALAAVFFASPARLETQLGRGVLLTWNTLGLVDILSAMATAARTLVAGTPERMFALLTFPFSLIPVLVVPLIVLTHVWIYLRVWSHRRQAHARRP